MASLLSTKSRMFAGKYPRTLDDKNRVTIPSGWREEEPDEFWIIKNPHRPCLTVMLPDVFASLAADAKAHATPSDHQDFIRFMYSEAQNTTADKQGRLLLSEEHCNQAGIRGDVMLAGTYDRIEIWSLATWNKSKPGQDPKYLAIAKKVRI